jgi:hypothetical protein
MALGHMLAVKGSEPTLTAAAGNAPLLDPGQVVLAELNPHNAAADDGLLERFAAAFADAIR